MTTNRQSVARLSARPATAATPKAAIAAYDKIAADGAVGAVLQDLAALRAGAILVDTASFDEAQRRLEPLTANDRTFRHTARELLALSAWRANDAAATRQWLDLIANDGETPPSLRSRAEALQGLLPPVAKS